MNYLNKYIPKKNSALLFTWISFAIRSFGNLLLLPIILTKFELSDINMYFIYILILELTPVIYGGLTTTISRNISYHKTSKATIKSLIFYQFKIIKIVCLVFISVGLFGYYILSSHINDSILSKNLMGFYFLMFLIIINAFYSILTSFFEGINRIDFIRKIESLTGVFSIISSVLVVYYIKNLNILLISLSFWAFFSLVILLYSLIKSLNFKVQEYSHPINGNILINSLKSSIGDILTIGLRNIFSLSLPLILSPTLLSQYLLTNAIFSKVSHFSNAPFYIQIPLLNTLFSSSDIKNLIKIGGKYIGISLLIVTSIFAFLFLFGQDILDVFKIDSFFLETKYFLIFSLSIIVERFGSMVLQLTNTSDRIITHKATFIYSVSLLIFYFFILKESLMGYLLSLLFASVIYASYNFRKAIIQFKKITDTK